MNLQPPSPIGFSFVIPQSPIILPSLSSDNILPDSTSTVPWIPDNRPSNNSFDFYPISEPSPIEMSTSEIFHKTYANFSSLLLSTTTRPASFHSTETVSENLASLSSPQKESSFPNTADEAVNPCSSEIPHTSPSTTSSLSTEQKEKIRTTLLKAMKQLKVTSKQQILGRRLWPKIVQKVNKGLNKSGIGPLDKVALSTYLISPIESKQYSNEIKEKITSLLTNNPALTWESFRKTDLPKIRRIYQQKHVTNSTIRNIAKEVFQIPQYKDDKAFVQAFLRRVKKKQ